MLVFNNGGPGAGPGAAPNGPERPLNPYELFTEDERIILTEKDGDNLVVGSNRIPLATLTQWFTPPHQVNAAAPNPADLAAGYDELGWDHQIGTFRLAGYKGKDNTAQAGKYYLIAFNAAGDAVGLMTAQQIAPKLASGGGGAEEDLNIMSHAEAMSEEREDIKELRKYLPGPTSFYLPTPDDRESRERDWVAAITELNGFQNHIDNFQKVKDRVNGIDVPKKFITDPRWIGRVEKIAQDFETLYGSMQGMNLSDETKRKLRSRQRQDILDALDLIMADFERPRDEAMNKIKEQMRGDFDFRLTTLKDRWENETPKHFEEEKGPNIRYIEEHQAALRDALNNDASFEEYVAIFEKIRKLEDRYIYATEARTEDVSIDELEFDLKNLEYQKKNELDPAVAAFQAQVEEAMKALDHLDRTIQNNPYIKDEFKKDEKKIIEKLRKNLSSWQDISAIFDDVLGDQQYYLDEEGNKIYLMPEDGDEGIDNLQQGLRHKLNYIKQKGLEKGDIRSLALGLQEAIRKASDEMDKLKNEGANDLEKILDQIESYQEMYNAPPPAGGKYEWHFISIQNVKRSGEIIKEWVVRKFGRDQNYRVGKTLSHVLQPLENVPYLKTLPNEFDKTVEQAESDEVNAYKEIYDNKDAWEIIEIQRRTNNVDELKACFILLAEKGRIRWDDPAMFEAIKSLPRSNCLPKYF